MIHDKIYNLIKMQECATEGDSSCEYCMLQKTIIQRGYHSKS